MTRRLDIIDADNLGSAMSNANFSTKQAYLRFPVVSHSAEYLVMGYLMRRNILAYKAPPNNEGYDLICIHPDPRRVTKQIRVQDKAGIRPTQIEASQLRIGRSPPSTT